MNQPIPNIALTPVIDFAVSAPSGSSIANEPSARTTKTSLPLRILV
jgi:hypothetical protein